jgi:thioredoxin-like negative regulator of GroEL
MNSKNMPNVDDILQAYRKKPLLLILLSESIGSCHIMAPVIERLQDEYSDKLAFCVITLEDDLSVADKLSVSNLPGLILFDQLEMVEKLEGINSERKVFQRIDSALSQIGNN